MNIDGMTVENGTVAATVETRWRKWGRRAWLLTKLATMMVGVALVGVGLIGLGYLVCLGLAWCWEQINWREIRRAFYSVVFMFILFYTTYALRSIGNYFAAKAKHQGKVQS